MHRFFWIIYIVMLTAVALSLTACQKEDRFTLNDMESEQAALSDTDSEADASAECDVLTEAEASVERDVLTEAEAADVYVFVCGQVVNPGVYCLPKGSRICDAVDMAGGCLETADIHVVNQAECLTDGEKIYIPALGEECPSDTAGASGSGMAAGSSGVRTDGMSGAGTGRLNLNTATREELLQLPGIGETKADAILEYRESRGSFTSIEELMNIAGIKEGVFSKIKEYITVE